MKHIVVPMMYPDPELETHVYLRYMTGFFEIHVRNFHNSPSVAEFDQFLAQRATAAEPTADAKRDAEEQKLFNL